MLHPLPGGGRPERDHPGSMVSSERLVALLREVKELAREYYELTEKPLGVTGEIAEYEVARILKLELSRARQSGYDAVREGDGKTERLGRGDPRPAQ